MERKAFHYDLPPELIAQGPLPERSESRLLVLDGASGWLSDRRFGDLVELLAAGDLLVLNDTRVLPARLKGRKATGGAVEILLERVTGARTARVQIKASRSPKPASRLVLEGGASAEIVCRQGEFFEIRLDRDCLHYFQVHGDTPLPPYVRRPVEPADAKRYQTVYARRLGAVAAPTAGLHFDARLLAALAEHGVDHEFLTLHVGAGTFSPVRVERIEDHELHEEWLEVGTALCHRIAATRAQGGRVVAVGTTCVRALEAAAAGGCLQPLCGESKLFIYPGFKFRVVDAMITNLHLPESSLLMLVSAFAGHDATMHAYRHAVAQRYRFFSYGDAMFVTPSRRTTSRDAL